MKKSIVIIAALLFALFSMAQTSGLHIRKICQRLGSIQRFSACSFFLTMVTAPTERQTWICWIRPICVRLIVRIQDFTR